MAMTSTITAPLSAQMGTPTYFTVTVSNGGGAQVSIYSMQPTVKLPNGQTATCCTIGPIIATAQLGNAQVGGSQFNVPVAASGSQSFSFEVCFFGPAISGGPTQPSMAFVVDCISSYSDSTSGGTLAPVQVNLNQPQFGQGSGSPPNPAVVVGQLDFQVPLNGSLTL